MDSFAQIHPIHQYQLNNAELEFFVRGTVSNILKSGYTKLGIAKGQFDPYNANSALLSDIVSQSRISDRSALIAEADRKCDALLRYFYMQVDTGCLSPVEADRRAYISIANAIAPYRGLHKLPQHQQIAQTRGLVLDVSRAGMSENIVQLNLTSSVQAIDNANVEYALLVDGRREEQAEKRLPPTGGVRRELYEQYDVIITVVLAHHLVNPTPESTSFIKKQNALIDETNARYNQRMGLLHHYKEQKEQEDNKEDQ